MMILRQQTSYCVHTSLYLLCATLLAACDGSGSSSSPDDPPPVVSTKTVEAFVAKGALQGAQCSIFDATDDSMGGVHGWGHHMGGVRSWIVGRDCFVAPTGAHGLFTESTQRHLFKRLTF
ncbi:MAG: hypothetical protein ISP99_06525 [Pseudomonadales bacterium]|nr:hypothetical protein [Pseudomonadales bacterium]